MPKKIKMVVVLLMASNFPVKSVKHKLQKKYLLHFPFHTPVKLTYAKCVNEILTNLLMQRPSHFSPCNSNVGQSLRFP